MPSTALYFGYGSNLDADDFEAWALEHGFTGARLRLAGRAFVPEHALVFHYFSESRGGGALDMVPSSHGLVPGALFRLEGDASRALDRKEGAGTRYERFPLVALTLDGHAHEAFSYRVRDNYVEPDHVEPTAEYVDIVRRGLRVVGQQDSSLDAAIAHTSPPPWPLEVFVYGTLKRGECRESMMRAHRPTSVTMARAQGQLLDLGPYPGLIHVSDQSSSEVSSGVTGELWRYPDVRALLNELDEVEDFHGFGQPHSLYERRLLELTSTEAARVAWTYFYVGERSGLPTLTSGGFSGVAHEREE